MQALLHGDDFLGVIIICAFGDFGGWDGGFAVGPVVDFTFCNGMQLLAIAVVVHDRADWTIDGKLLPVYAETGELGVEIGEVTTLQERIVGKADTCFMLEISKLQA